MTPFLVLMLAAPPALAVKSAPAAAPVERSAKSREAEAWVAKGDVLHQHGNSKAAIKAYAKAAKLDPLNVDALLGRAFAYSDLEKYDSAALDADAALRIAPKLAKVRMARGRFFADWGANDKAAEEYGAAIEADPANVRAYLGRARAYAGQGRYDRALLDVNAVLDRKPNDAEALARKGRIYNSLEDFLLAREYLDAAIKADPNLSDPYSWRAESRRSLGDEQGAKADEAKAKELAPS